MFYSVYCKSLPFPIYQHQSNLLIWPFKCSCFYYANESHWNTERGRRQRRSCSEEVWEKEGEREGGREREKEGGKERGREKECYDVTPVVHWNTKAAERKTHTHTHTHTRALLPVSLTQLHRTLLQLWMWVLVHFSLSQHTSSALSSLFVLIFTAFSFSLSLDLSVSSLSLSLSCAEQLRLFWLELQLLIYLTAAFSPALFLIVALLPTSRVFCAASLCVNVSVPGCLYCPSLTYSNSKSSLSASSQF